MSIEPDPDACAIEEFTAIDPRPKETGRPLHRRKLGGGWHAHLVALLERGIQQGIFRNSLNVPLCARAMMVALRGIGYQSRLPRRKVRATA